MTTAIIGTGGIGSVIARQLVSGGETLRLASADNESARTLAAEIGRAAVVAVDNRDALQGADAVVLALRFAVLKGVIDEIADPLTDKLVVVPSNPLSVDAQGNASRLLAERESSGEVLAGWLQAGARFDSRSARPTFQDLANLGSRSVTGHCNRSGRDARVILRGASLGDVYEARWWPDWTGTGCRTVTAPVFPDIRINALPEGYSRASAARADAERWPCSSVLTAVGVLPAGERGPVPSVGRLSGSPPQCPRRPWLEKLVIRSREALCASGRKAYYNRYSSGPRQLHSHGVAHVAVGSGFNAFIDLRRK